MALSRTLRSVAVTLALVVPATGCVATQGSPSYASRAEHSQRTSSILAFEDQGPAPFIDDALAPGAGLSFTGGHGARAAWIVAAVFLFPLIILVDLLTLPFACANHHPFYCTTAVIHHCSR
jgi:hypothetical protein